MLDLSIPRIIMIWSCHSPKEPSEDMPIEELNEEPENRSSSKTWKQKDWNHWSINVHVQQLDPLVDGFQISTAVRETRNNRTFVSPGHIALKPAQLVGILVGI